MQTKDIVAIDVYLPSGKLLILPYLRSFLMSLPDANAVVRLKYGAVERDFGFLIMHSLHDQLAPIDIREIMFNILNISRGCYAFI